MPSKTDCWGIEVGSHALKAVHLVKTSSGVLLDDYAILPFKRVLTTPDLNVEEMIQVQLDTLISKHDLGKSSVVVSVPGNKKLARFAKLPPVAKKEIPNIVRYEAAQQIPFPMEEVEWDYHVFQQEDSPDVEVGIFAITKENIAHFLSNFNAVNLTIDSATLSPLAVYNAFVHGEEDDEKGMIYIDIGTTTTDVIIVENGSVWTRTFTIGGNSFTEALVKSFKLSFPKAEKLKREARTSKYARQIFQAMRPVFAELVQEIQRTLGHYRSFNRDSEFEKIVGVGSTFKLPGLLKFLKQQLQMDVVRPGIFEGAEIAGRLESEIADNAINLATAYGLALQGIGEATVSANILPDMILRERMWKAKQGWFAGAAAMMLLACGASTAVYFKDAAATEKSFDDNLSRVRMVTNKARGYQSSLNEVSKEDPRVKVENLNRMLDYRTVWPSILEDINMASAAQVENDDATRELQLATFTADYKTIAELPRPERKRVYIEKISAQFEPIPVHEDPNAGLGMASEYSEVEVADPIAGQFTLDNFWKVPSSGDFGGYDDYGEYSDGYDDGSGYYEESGESYDEGEESYDEGEESSEEDGSELEGPRFVITIEGTTPYKNPHVFLSQHFIQWLKDNADRADRPYTIELPETPLVNIAKIGALDSNRGGLSGEFSRYEREEVITEVRPDTMVGNREQYDAYEEEELLLREELGTMGMEGGSVGTVANMERSTGAATAEEIMSLLPEYPLKEERVENDYRFTIKWYVQLRKPLDARRSEKPELIAEGDAGEGGAVEGEGQMDDAEMDTTESSTEADEEVQV